MRTHHGSTRKPERIDLNLSTELKKTLSDAAWRSRLSMNEWVLQAIAEKLERDAT
jgi:predicted HicB family RNase H-like nuclease